MEVVLVQKVRGFDDMMWKDFLSIPPRRFHAERKIEDRLQAATQCGRFGGFIRR